MLTLTVNFQLEVKALAKFPKAPSSDLFFSCSPSTTSIMFLQLEILILVADGTSVFMSHKNLEYHPHTLNSEISKVSARFRANKLSFDLKKKLYHV